MLRIQYVMHHQELQKEVKTFMEEHAIQGRELDVTLYFIEIQDFKMISQIDSFLQKQTKPFELVFISEQDDMIFRLLSFKPFAFLRTTQLQADLCAMIDSLQKQSFNNSSLTIKTGNAIVRLDINNILYIESFAHYLILHTPFAQYKTRGSISELMKQLDSTAFIRCHKSYIVHMKYIEKIVNETIHFSNSSDTIPIGRNYKKEIVERFQVI